MLLYFKQFSSFCRHRHLRWAWPGRDSPTWNLGKNEQKKHSYTDIAVRAFFHHAAELLHQKKSQISKLSLAWQSSTDIIFFWWWTGISWDCWSDTSVKHVLHLSLAPLLLRCGILLAKLCLRSAFVLAWPKFLYQHNSAVTAQVGDAQIDLEMLALDEKHGICFDRDFTFCSARHVQHPWLIVQRFSFFSVGQNREWILNTCCDRAETIQFILDLVKDEDKYFLPFALRRAQFCTGRLWKQKSDKLSALF